MLDFITQHDRPAVLLIDDDLVSREVMATMLTMGGYPVQTAPDGAQALDLLDRKSCTPAIILMDAQMPGISGLPLIEQLRARCKARLYVISASSTPEDVKAAADGFILKPFPPETLTHLIEEQEAQARPSVKARLDPEEVIVDPHTLAQLRGMMPDKGVRQIYEAIVADLGRRTTALKIAILDAQWTEARRIGHAIKGGAAMAGALQIARLGSLIETGALEHSNVNQSDNSSVILAELAAAALNLQRMLDAEIKV
jgi:CheY-like chemotaxis protein